MAAVDGVAVSPVCLPDGTGETIGTSRNEHEVDVVGHQAVADELHAKRHCSRNVSGS